MFYRYEGRVKDKSDAEWQGIFTIFNPSQRHKWYCLPVPKWYEANEGIKSRAWFTDYGFDKYHDKMDNMLEEIENRYDIRILKTPVLQDIVMHGKVQVIQKI